jgi:rod shape determining protein RodA
MLWQRIKERYDFVMMLAMLLILAFGLAMIYSATISAQTIAEGRGAFPDQILFVAVGIGLYFFLALFDYRLLIKWALFLYVGLLLLLVLVLLIGLEVNGARRWLDLGIGTLQPSEIAKFVLVIVGAAVLSQQSRFTSDIRLLWLGGATVVFPVVLILVQPDFGTAFLLFAFWLGTMAGIGVKGKWFLIIVLVTSLVAPLGWSFLRSYQQERVLVLLDPGRSPKGSAYNVTQAKIAIGSGGLSGKGLGQGTQSQLKFLPVRHTDFIFSVIAEELGFIGCLVVLSLYAILLLRILRALALATSNMGRYILLGVFWLMTLQAVINIGMNVGILPATGVPLPLISAGGSSLVVMLAMLGVVQSVLLYSDKRSEVDVVNTLR